MKNPTKKQNIILAILREHKTPMAKKEILSKTKAYWYANESKHLGDMLSRMVERGFLHRPERGLYALGAGKKSNPVDPGQMSLF